MAGRNSLVATVLVTGLTVAACSSADPTATPGPPSSAAEPQVSTVPETSAPPSVRTPELDAIGVIGHSGATGWNSEGDQQDAKSNSWATGDNPAVVSIYRRLVGDHPGLVGHGWNEAVSGSDVTSLEPQALALLTHDPVPDIVLIQSIDNDIRCDGSDEQHYDFFEDRLDAVLTYLRDTAPGIKVFFMAPWASVETYDDVVSTMPGGIDHLTDTGPCAVYNLNGKRDPKAEAYLQRQFDVYFERIVRACARMADCATDEGALQDMPLAAADLTDDFNHLSVAGQAKMAAMVWEALPAGWK